MRNPLQEQLLKAGLAKKQKVDDAARALKKQKHGKSGPKMTSQQLEAQRLRSEKAEADRALAAEQKALARAKELKAQVRQIIETHKVHVEGEVAYRFADNDKIKEILVDPKTRDHLANGMLVIAEYKDGYALLPRKAAEMIYQREGHIVSDHGKSSDGQSSSEDDEYYAKFEVPDDLIW